ncbi:MAG: phosphoglycolate phosphatase [Marinosulfonomonas sp.]|nr:phosphoglycolate phosphatase [Marinosulfonomonas sp.]
MKPAIVFDLDGTLIDSAPDLHAACVKMLADEGAPTPSLETVITYIGNGVPRLVELAMADAGIATGEHARLVQAFMVYYDADPATLTTIYPNLLPLLEMLHSNGHKMAVCTNKPEAPARVILNILDIEKYFDVVVGGDTLAQKKPDPAPLLHCLTLLDTDACIYVGDSEVDAETADRAGQPMALFTKGYRKVPVADLPHDFAFDDFAALGPFIESHKP